MKQFIYILNTLILSMQLISCVSLEEDVRSNVSTTNYYNTVEDAEAASIGLYSNLTHNYSGQELGLAQTSQGVGYYNRMSFISFGTLTDNDTPGQKGNDAEYRATCYFNHTPVGSKFQHFYRLGWEIINNANSIIDRVPKIEGKNQAEIDKLDRIVKEAKFIRALIYFNSIRFYGDVPLIVHETTSLSNLKVYKTPKADVLVQIKQDLNDALSLPSTRYSDADGFRVNSVAVRALLIDVALYEHDWQGAVGHGDAIIQNSEYSLFDDFADVFSTTQKNKKEHIFDAYYYADGTSGGSGNTNRRAGADFPVYGYPAKTVNGVVVTPALEQNGSASDGVNLALRNQYKTNDKRVWATFADYIYSNSARTKKIYYPHLIKFRDYTTSVPTNSGVNYPILRLAGVYLNYAEAQNELGNFAKAREYLNKVRHRAGVFENTSLADKDLLRDSIFHERRLEFAGEVFNRYFDLVRLNGSGHYLMEKAIPALLNSGLKGVVDGVDKDGDKGLSYETSVSKNANYAANPTKYLLLPIPYVELLANPNLLPQNYGW